jgi:hypothetical protein
METRSACIARLADSPTIVQMAQDLIDADVAPSHVQRPDWGDFVFAAAMTYVMRSGDAESLDVHFDAAAEAVIVAYDRLHGLI